MPIYEYVCQACGKETEILHKISDPTPKKCPKCGKMAQRLLSTPAVVFKGSGFYKTDSRGAASGESSSGDSSSDKPAGTPSTTPVAATDGAGHTHGAGGHTHDAPAPATKAADTPTPTAKTTTTDKPSAK